MQISRSYEPLERFAEMPKGPLDQAVRTSGLGFSCFNFSQHIQGKETWRRGTFPSRDSSQGSSQKESRKLEDFDQMRFWAGPRNSRWEHGNFELIGNWFQYLWLWTYLMSCAEDSRADGRQGETPCCLSQAPLLLYKIRKLLTWVSCGPCSPVLLPIRAALLLWVPKIHPPTWRSANFFCTLPDSKYFIFCGSYKSYYSSSTLLLWQVSFKNFIDIEVCILYNVRVSQNISLLISLQPFE